MRTKAALIVIIFLMLVSAMASSEELVSVDEDNEQSLPLDVINYFQKTSICGYSILGQALFESDDMIDGTFFVLIHTTSNTNVLYCFTKSLGVWNLSFYTQEAIPQKDEHVTIYPLETIFDDIREEEHQGKFLVIGELDEHHEEMMLGTIYQLNTSGEWLLFHVWSHGLYDKMWYRDTSISFYGDLENTNSEHTVYGLFPRNLRRMRLEIDISYNYDEAQSWPQAVPLLTEQQEISASLGHNAKYVVYSAPNINSLCGAKGKAAVSTNGRIMAYGKEAGWIMIQYEIDENNNRIGYIHASLPKNVAIPELSFTNYPMNISSPAFVTDDPLRSHRVLTQLPENSTVIWLAMLDKWAYVEGSSFRGFVPVKALAVN